MQQQVARYFQQHVAEEEDAARETKHRWTETQLLVHVQRGETDIDPVQIVEEHHREEQGH